MSTVKNTAERMSGLEKSSAEQAQRLAELEAQVAELRQSVAQLKASPAPKPKKGKKAAAEVAEGEEKPTKPQSAWNQLVAQTVADMKENGWESWTDLKGVVWPASKRALVKDKKGVESEAWVYDGGENDGKVPTPAIGGMVRSSCLKAQNDPEAMTKALAHHAKKAAEKSSQGSVSEGAEAPKKARAKMTEAQKAAAAAKRAAKKAAEAATVETEELEMAEEESTTPVASPMVGGGGSAAAAKPKPQASASAKKAPKAAPKKLDLTLFAWTHEGVEYLTNDRQDVFDNQGDWVGRFNGTEIEEMEEPADLEGVQMREA
jgi:uncharacterized coiled-coil protein SlyX